MYMPSVGATAVWYCPDAETDTDVHSREAAAKAQVTPKSLDMYMYPPLTTAVWYCPDAEIDTEYQFRRLSTGFQVCPIPCKEIPNFEKIDRDDSS